MSSEPEDTFGHFLLNLTMNKGHIDAKLAERVFQVRTRYLELKMNRPERHALRNLLAMLAFRLNQFEEAFRYLDEILSDGEDPDNLNVLANRKYMCEKLFRLSEARDCEQRIAELLIHDGTEDGKNRCKMLRVRSLAEQGFAYSYELFDETVTVERYRKSVDYYEQATKLAGNLIGQDDKEDWVVVYGMACHKIYTKCRLDKSLHDQAKDWFQKAVKNFFLIVQFIHDKRLVSESWRHLGELFKQPRNLLPSIPKNMRIYVDHPWKCYEEALLASPRDPRILARYAAHYQRTRDYSIALSKVNESISLDSSVFNLHAYYVRASIWIDIYKKQVKDFKKSYVNIPDSNLLETAENDLRIALSNSSTPWHLHCMAEVFYYKAKDPNGQIKQGREAETNLQLALTYCAKAVACQDGQKNPHHHKLRGECLSALGEHQAALGCFKRAVECETAVKFFIGSGNSLVNEFEHILKCTKPALPDISPLLADMVYWLKKVADIYLSIDWTLWSLQKLKKLDIHWKMLVDYCEDNGKNTELAAIELAATEKLAMMRHQSYPGACSVNVTTMASEAKTSENRGGTASGKAFGTCHPAEEVATTSAETIPGKTGQDVETVEASLSTIELEENALPPDIIHITYAVNIKTGKSQHVSTTPSCQNVFDNDPKGDVRVAPKKSLNRLEMKYDFFVIYSSSASEWVQHRMLEELEGTGLKGCVKDRDFSLGKPKEDNYSDSITNSVCTIIVITRDFETNQYDVRGMLRALDSDKPVIPVLREARDIPSAIKHIEYLDATGAVDWARLERSIEQQIKLDVSWDL